MNICTDKVTDWMIRCKVINESEKELHWQSPCFLY